MRSLSIFSVAVLLAGAVPAFAQSNSTTITTNPGGGLSGSTTIDHGKRDQATNTNNDTIMRDGKRCRVVRSSEAGKGGSVSSSVTAGGGTATSSSSGGSSVTINSGNGSSASTATATGAGGTTTMTTSNGDCVVVVPDDKK